VNTLRELEGMQFEFGAGRAEPKQRCLERLGRARLGSARDVARLHELALYCSALPDSPGVLTAARALLDRCEGLGRLRN